jgi:hypothetical protein
VIDRQWFGLIELLLTFGSALVGLLWYSARLKREIREDKLRREADEDQGAPRSPESPD